MKVDQNFTCDLLNLFFPHITFEVCLELDIKHYIIFSVGLSFKFCCEMTNCEKRERKKWISKMIAFPFVTYLHDPLK